jgi:hypothetical protein
MAISTIPSAGISSVSATTVSSGTLPFAQLPTGSVLQVVSYPSYATTSTGSTSYVTTSLSTTITPKFSTSKVLVIVNGGEFDTNGTGAAIYASIFRNGSNLGPAYGMTDAYGTSSRLQLPASASYLDSPATTSSVTYALYFKSATGSTVYYNANAVQANIILMEIAG